MPSFLTTDGVKIRFEVMGTGPPLLVCHGGPSSVCDTLISDLAGLSPYFTLVFHDYRGSGQSSTAPGDTYTFPRLADDLEELRRHLKLGSVQVLAHSMGGLVAMEFALRARVGRESDPRRGYAVHVSGKHRCSHDQGPWPSQDHTHGGSGPVVPGRLELARSEYQEDGRDVRPY